MNSLLNLAISRPLAVNLILLFFIVLGLFTVSKISVDIIPPHEGDKPIIRTYLHGSSPADIEVSITLPLEKELMAVDGIKEIRSYSLEGSSIIELFVNPDINGVARQKLYTDIQKAIDIASAKLPAEIKQKPVLVSNHTDDLPVAELMISGSVSEDTLRLYARRIESELREMDYIAGIRKKGYRDREIKISLDQEALHNLNITVNEVKDAVIRRNVRDSVGSINSFVSSHDVVVLGQFQDIKEIRDLIIRTDGVSDHVRIRDIGIVYFDFEKPDVLFSSNGREGISLYPVKASSANGLVVSRSLKRYVEQKKVSLPAGIDIVMLNDFSRHTSEMIRALVSNALTGVLLVFGVLLLFFPSRMAFWVAAGIPVSFLITFILMPFFGISINLIVIAGMILMLGIIVDDAIVVSESIYSTTRQFGVNVEAIVNGLFSVLPAVITGALTSILAFVPLIFIGGVEGKIMWMMPITVIIILLASLFECIVFLPVHIHHSLKRGFINTHFSTETITAIEKKVFIFVQNMLRRKYRYLFTSIAIFIIVLFFGVQNVRIDPILDSEVDAFCVQAEFPADYSLDATMQELQTIEAMVKEIVAAEEYRHINVIAGEINDCNPNHRTRAFFSSHGMVKVELVDFNKRQNSSSTYIHEIRSKLHDKTNAEKLLVLGEKLTPSFGKPVQVEVIGNSEARQQIVSILSEHLRQQAGVTEVWSSMRRGKSILNLSVDYEKIANYGISIKDIVTTSKAAFSGLVIDKIQMVDEEIDIRLELSGTHQVDENMIGSIVIYNQDNQPIPLRSVAMFTRENGVVGIDHYNGERSTTVYADINKDIVSTSVVNDTLLQFVEESNLKGQFPEIRLNLSGEIKQRGEALSNSAVAALLALMAIYFLVAILFDSLLKPFIVLAVIPFSIIGVFFGFAIHNMNVSFGAILAIVGLMGLVVNDALIIIDRMNKSSADGINIERMSMAVMSRFKPVVITTLTTVAGLLPSAYGFWGGHSLSTPMIMAMLWGVIFSGVITLIIVPCLYGAVVRLSDS